MLPEGAVSFVGKNGEDVAVTFEKGRRLRHQVPAALRHGHVALIVVGNPTNEDLPRPSRRSARPSRYLPACSTGSPTRPPRNKCRGGREAVFRGRFRPFPRRRMFPQSGRPPCLSSDRSTCFLSNRVPAAAVRRRPCCCWTWGRHRSRRAHNRASRAGVQTVASSSPLFLKSKQYGGSGTPSLRFRKQSGQSRCSAVCAPTKNAFPAPIV